MSKHQTKHKSKSFELPRPLTHKQVELIRSIENKDMTLVFGSAGTGKTFLPAVYAAYYYHLGRIDKIILTRPTVPVGKGIGFLPGTLEEKLMPWVIPFVQVLEKYLSVGEVECMLKNGKLQVVPFDTIRGHTFNDAFIILDEAQNTTITEIKAFVTRIGENSKTVINGDIAQSDLKNNENSGLEYLLDLLGDIDNEELSDKVGVIEFDYKDCVRSSLCKLWVKAFS